LTSVNAQAPSGPARAEADDRVDISVLVPVLNEERHIRETVAAMQAQRFDGTIELLFADGCSTDRTREILLELAAADPRIRVLENPRRGTASGLNVCLREARGEFVARMDAHTFYAETYLAAGVERLRRGGTEWVSGPMIPRPVGPVSGAVALAVSTWLGRGGSRKWSHDAVASEESELDTGVFCGVWRRSRVLEAGGWDERWPINQDSEMAARFLAQGAKLVSLPEMAGHYVPRDSLRRLARQYYRYGLYRARTFRRHPQSMRRSQLLPPGLAMSVITSLAAPRWLRRTSRVAVGVYAGVVAVTGARAAARRETRREGAMLIAVLPTMHLGWGFGTLAGMLRFGPPLAALAELMGGGAPARKDASREEPVYAPSLHSGDA
jgi:succinoglycan biosynthesis protein ExoA